MIKNKIIKTELVDWRSLEWLQGDLKELSDESFGKLKQSLKNNDFIMPFNVWNNGKTWILDGHHRKRALTELEKEGYEIPLELPANFIDCKNKKEATKLVLVYSSIYASVTEQGLTDFMFDNDLTLDDLDEIDLANFDMDKFTLSPEVDEDKLDEIPEVPQKALSKLGDIFLIDGKHRVMCGDSTKREDVDMLLDGCSIYDVLTDPPYNIDFNYNKIDDKKTDEEYAQFCIEWFTKLYYVGLIVSPGPKNENCYPKPRDKGIWVKKNATAGASCFHLRTCEPILFYGNFNGKRNTDLFDYSSGFTKELKEARRSAGVLHSHAPAKSINLWTELASMLGKSVVDVFGGNGTTLIVCQHLNKTAYLLELSENYIDVILKRYKNLYPNAEFKCINREFNFDELWADQAN